MLTLYHSPQSRSSRIIWLLEELGASYEIKQVSIFRMMSQTGAPDPANPHPDKKVPYLVDGETKITESVAMAVYLTDLHPEAGLAPKVSDNGRGAYLNWLAYYAGVVEPVVFNKFSGLEDNEAMRRNYRGMEAYFARIEAALSAGPWLLGESFSAVDLFYASLGQWMRDGLPAGATVDDWLKRCLDRPALKRAMERDGTL